MFTYSVHIQAFTHILSLFEEGNPELNTITSTLSVFRMNSSVETCLQREKRVCMLTEKQY